MIALMANALLDDRKTCLDAGMDDFITKPIRDSAMRETVAKWLSPGEAK